MHLSGWPSFLRSCGTSIESVFVVPGNHDAVRKIAGGKLIQSMHHSIKASDDLSTDDVIRGFLTDEEARDLLYKPLNNYNEFALNFFCSLLPPDRTIAERKLFLNDGSELRLLGLNSAFVSSESDKQGTLYVDPAAKNVIKESGVEKVVLCHHPYTWLHKGMELNDHLDVVTRLQLFGHDHTNRINVARDFVRVFASAAHPDRKEPGWEPGYNLIELTVSGGGAARQLDVGVHVRVWQQQPGQFRAKMDKENDVFQQSIPLDPWSAPKEEVEEGCAVQEEEASDHATTNADALGSDPMDSIRDISVRYLKLSFSQKNAIAGALGLLEEDDAGQPDFERFRRVLIRARERGLIEALDQALNDSQGRNS